MEAIRILGEIEPLAYFRWGGGGGGGVTFKKKKKKITRLSLIRGLNLA
jgi:hypothetical protein